MTSDADRGADGNGYGAITVNRYAVNPELDDAGLAHWLYSLGTTFIFFRTRHPLTTTEMRRRAALLVTSVSNGTFPDAGTTSPPTPCAGALRRRPVADARRRRSTTTTASHLPHTTTG